MPIYTYLCKKCALKSDFLVGMSQEKLRLKCPKCGSLNLEKQFAPFMISSAGPGSSSSSKCSSCSSGNCSGCH